jgi:anhydro-N-acetylmuramic acid kinase
MSDPYLKLRPPKSTGREYYGRVYIAKILALGRRHHAKLADLIRAATIFTALSVVDALNRFVLPKTKIHQLIISGGGVQNPLILAQLTAALGVGPVGTQSASGGHLHLGNQSISSKGRFLHSSSSKQIEILPSSHFGIPESAKESFAFALLAYETLHHRPSNLPSATGAQKPAILGKISYAPPR